MRDHLQRVAREFAKSWRRVASDQPATATKAVPAASNSKTGRRKKSRAVTQSKPATKRTGRHAAP